MAAGADDGDAAADGLAAGAAGADPADPGATSVAGSTGAIARAIGSQRTLACRPLGSALRSLIVNGMPRLTVDPAVVTLAMSGTAEGQARPAQRRLERSRRRSGGAGGSGGAGQDVLGASPLFMTIDRSKPEVAPAGSICAT